MSTSSTTPPPNDPTGSASLPAAVRQRLEQVFLHAKRCFEKGDHDYAHDLYTQCVAEDPANLAYLQHFRANLAKKHGEGKKASAFGGLLSKSGRGGVEKAVAKAKWSEAFTAGCQALKKNQGDLGVLQAMSAACGERGHTDCQLFYLRWALDIDATDIETNRQAGMALAAVQQFDQAIACWQRIKQQKPLDEEAAKQVARLSVEKTIHAGGYNPALLSGDGADAPTLAPARVADHAAKRPDGAPRAPVRGGGDTTIEEPDEDLEAREQRLLSEIAAAPTDGQRYTELATLYAAADRLQDAERLLAKGIKAVGLASGAGVLLQEQLEDIYLRRVRQQVEIAERRVRENGDDKAKDLLKRMVKQANQAELEVYSAQAKRSPGDSRLQFELGLRQKRVGDYREAIKSFQAARGDAQRAGETHILIGECFQHIEQYKLAMASYETAVEAAGPAKEEVRKLALYRAAVLAMGMKDLDRAEQRLSELAALDFSYRDVADRLDKVAAMRNDA